MAVSLRKERRREITDYCSAVCDYRTLSEDFSTGKHRSGHAGSCRIPSELLPQHVERAQEDRARLDDIRTELTHVAKMVIKDALTPLLHRMWKLQKLADGMSLKSPALESAQAFVARCNAKCDKPNALELGDNRDLRKVRDFMIEVDQCCHALELLKPFVDASAPKSKHHRVEWAYLNSLGKAQNAAMEGDWMGFNRHLEELEFIVSPSGRAPATTVSYA